MNSPVTMSSPVNKGAIVHQIIDPGFLHTRLEEIRKDGTGQLSDEQYEQMFADLTAAKASPVSGADAAEGKQAYLPRSPAVSLLQSTLTDCVVSRFEDLVEPAPADKRSFAEFALEEGDVFRQFGPCDARWAESVISKGLSLLKGKPKFVDGRAPDVSLAENARVVVVGDWGSGLSGAQAVGQEMAKKAQEAKGEGREVHALHLGDVYYSGWKEEYQTRFLPYWPVQSADEGVASWALNGNHDMYSGGHGYFGFLLRKPLFAEQNGSSYFCLQNENWQLLGLDSSYEDADLAGDQVDWVTGKLKGSERKTMLLTHHQPFSAFATSEPHLAERLQPAFDERSVDAWLWGHEHLCCVYDSDPQPYLGFGSCIGHGGVPVLYKEAPLPAGVSWLAEDHETNESGDSWRLFGFAVLDFNGPKIDVSYYTQNGGAPVHSAVID